MAILLFLIMNVPAAASIVIQFHCHLCNQSTANVICTVLYKNTLCS